MRITTSGLLVVVGLTYGCASATAPPPKTPESIVRAINEPERVVEAVTGETIEIGDFFSRIGSTPVVYIGERHDRATDHAAQYAILRALHAEHPSLAIGMEMFQVPFQSALDEWTRGALDEANLRRRTEYDLRWGFDFSMYRPILEYARARGIQVVALNAPRELTRKVASEGLVGLSEEELASLTELDLADEDHRALFDRSFDSEAHEVPPEAVERYYQAQVIWDETMASRVAETLTRSNAPSRMIVLAGLVHVKGGIGIPRRAAKRGAQPFVVIVPLTEAELEQELDLPPEERGGDYYWVNGD